MASSHAHLGYIPRLQEDDEFGCSHYKRRCKLLAPCCNKFYWCRVCHDDNENHELKRRTVLEVACSNCQERQMVAKECIKCHVIFGNYFCSVCRLYDNEDKGQFHCTPCGICRAGGVNNFFHCPKCNLCLPVGIQYNHKCVENASRSDCAICTEDLHTSRDACKVPVCGHLLHSKCFDQLAEKGSPTCPTCVEPLEDLFALLNVGVLPPAGGRYQKPLSAMPQRHLAGAGPSSGGGPAQASIVPLKCLCCDRTYRGNSTSTICQYCGSKKVYPL